MDLLASRVTMHHVSHNKGGEWHGPCPVCGGNDRFHVWPDQSGGHAAQAAGMPGTWWCRQCDKGGDIIALVQAMDGCDFKAACRRLDIEMRAPARRRLIPPKTKPGWQPQICRIPDATWRQQAGKTAKMAHERLLATPYALDYLSGRGLPLEAISRFFLGYLAPEDKAEKGMYRARSAFGLADRVDKTGKPHRSLWLPAGISIPLWAGDAAAPEPEALRIRIRRRKGDLRPGDSKYLLLEGSGQMPMALPPVDVSPAMAVWVIVEAELDALAVHHACGGRVGVAAVLTNRGKPDAALHDRLLLAPLILVALDFDEAGENGQRPGYQGFDFWAKNYRQARRWPVPEGKDPGEAFALGCDLAEWVNAALPASLQKTEDRGRKTEDRGLEPVPLREGDVGAADRGRQEEAKSYEITLASGTKFHVTTIKLPGRR